MLIGSCLGGMASTIDGSTVSLLDAVLTSLLDDLVWHLEHPQHSQNRNDQKNHYQDYDQLYDHAMPLLGAPQGSLIGMREIGYGACGMCCGPVATGLFQGVCGGSMLLGLPGGTYRS
jgi:hypothetical protein